MKKNLISEIIVLFHIKNFSIRIRASTFFLFVDCLNNKNPCLNAGSCSLGTNRCMCQPGFSGDLCELVEPEVKCLDDRIEVHIQKAWAQHYAKIETPHQLYVGSQDFAEDARCQARDSPLDEKNYVITVDGQNSCGTEISRDNETLDFVYSNSVYAM